MACINGHPLIIELVGVAGAGKTSLLKVLMGHNLRIVRASPPPKIYYVPFVIRHFLRWFPLYFKNYSNTRWFTRKEIRQMGYLEIWLPYLHKCAVEKDLVIALDPGSVYWLTNLKYFGPEITESQQFKSWWNEMREKWVAALDLVIWLDAPTQLLMNRMINRQEEHESKHECKETILKQFSTLQKGYAEFLMDFTNSKNKHFKCFETNKIPTKVIAAEVLEMIENY